MKKKQATEGRYDLQWKSPTDWQDNLQVADFSQIRTAAVEKLVVRRSTPFSRLEVFQLLKLMHFSNLLRFSAAASARKLQERARNGSRERAIEVALPGRSAWKTVFLRRPVAIYGVIGTDGKWHTLAVVKSVDNEVDSYWLGVLLNQRFSAFPLFRFSSAKCGEAPVEQESVTGFRLP